MIYSEHFTVTWHDTDYNRNVRPSQVLVYMQETSNHHMMHCGRSLDELRDSRGLAFILSKITMELYLPLHAYDEIEVQTWTCPSRGFSIYRCFRVLRGNEVIAAAHTTWALLDLNHHRFARVQECGYPFEDEEPLVLETPSRIRFPAEPEKIGERTIRYSDLDYNMHMNNTKYPDMLCDFLPLEEVEHIRGMTLSYLHEAAYGDTMEISCVKSEGNYYIRTKGGAGETCLEAVVVLSS